MKDFYYYTASGYTIGGHGNYVILTVISMPKGEAPPKTWRGKGVTVLRRTGKLYSGLTGKCEHMRAIKFFKEEYPGIKSI